MSIIDKWILEIKEKSKREESRKSFPAVFEFLDKNYITGIDDFKNANPGVSLTDEDAFNCRIEFVKSWLKSTKDLNLSDQDRDLDDEQIAAVATLGHDVLVTARAGSGKTRTLVTRALFLIQKCNVKPDEILLTVFNTKARYEILNRIVKAIGKDKIPHIFNFHSLAWWIAKPKGDLFTKKDESDKKAFLKTIVLPEVFSENPKMEKLWDSLMKDHFEKTFEEEDSQGKAKSARIPFAPEGRFIDALITFINLSRKNQKKAPDQEDQVVRLETKKETEFFELAKVVNASYLENLSIHKKEDFDGLIVKAIEVIGRGGNTFPYNITPEKKGDPPVRTDLVFVPSALKHLMVDEYQDFSKLFYELVDSIRKRNPSIETFCVGDDWQAINGFAGSDLEYFHSHPKYFSKNPKTLTIKTNYRSVDAIVRYGNAVMAGNGVEAKASKDKGQGMAIQVNLEDFVPTNMIENHEFGIDRSLPVAIRVIHKMRNDLGEAGSNDLGFALLCRLEKHPQLNKPAYLERLVRYFGKDFAEKLIHRDKVHQYKGKQKHNVLILDAFDTHYPHKHPDWIFTKTFGNSDKKIRDEEQRLFYVAATRAIKNLFVFTSYSPSDFLSEQNLDRINWDEFPAVKTLEPENLVVVGNQEGAGTDPTKIIKGLLWKSGFYFQMKTEDPRLRHKWSKPYLAKSFSLKEILNREAWAKEGNGVEITVYGTNDQVIEKKNLG